MNRCAYQQNVFAACGEMSGPSVSASDSVVCPKPRRLGRFIPSINDQIRSPRRHINHQTEICDSKAGAELLDIILTKGIYCAEEANNIRVASPPPYFCGSPPSRASNPVVQDAEFGSNKLSLFAPAPIPTASMSSAARKGGSCVRMKFGQKPAAVRIEGFNCLSRDHGNCSSISAVA
ncbi:uncharacterized protein LOC132283325 [Cornus florida]|uniref:uncharacterized protein LOC132283325 n=1 Tax=Cornus florida TaxID=4283 RepID=UPI0028A03D92|nr:uncharacterized protein LOC132283325 [Cornus florida]